MKKRDMAREGGYFEGDSEMKRTAKAIQYRLPDGPYHLRLVADQPRHGFSESVRRIYSLLSSIGLSPGHLPLTVVTPNGNRRLLLL